MTLVRKSIYLLLSLLLCYSVEWTASLFTQSSVASWYVGLKKPSWNPPNIAFPIVWTLLYTMIAVSFWLILCKPSAYSLKTFSAFGVQLLANFTWSFAFFYLQSPALGLVNILVLLVAIFWNVMIFHPHSKLAAKLLIPYLLWVLYATTLNFSIWVNN